MYIEYQNENSADVHFFNIKDPKNNQDGISETEIKKVLCSIQRCPTNANCYLEEKINQIDKLKQDPLISELNFHIYFVTSACVKQIDYPTCTEFTELQTFGECKIIDAKILCDYAFLNTDKNPEKFILQYEHQYSVSHSYHNTEVTSYVVDITAEQLLNMCNKYSNSIFEYNVRNGLTSKINKSIALTAQNTPALFWLFNNGITILCDSIEDKSPNMNKLILENPRIINGCQTATTLESFFNRNSLFQDNLAQITVLARLHVINKSEEQEKIMDQIINYTNSQNPIVIKDLKSRNKVQKLVQNYFKEKGVKLEIRRGEFGADINFVRNDTIMQFYLALFRKIPAQAKRSKTQAFSTNFEIVFSEQNKDLSAQLYQAYLIRNFLLEKEKNNSNEDKSLLENADLSLAYTMARVSSNLLTDPSLREADTAYNSALNIIKQVINEAKSILGTRFSYNNLFKNPIVVDLLEKQLDRNKKNC